MIELHGAAKQFRTPDGMVDALHPTDLRIETGEIFGLLGFSGAGKSTLLRLINRLEDPSAGSIRVEGQEMAGLSGAALRAARRRIGMIFQQFNLLAQCTAVENVEFSLAAAGIDGAERRRRAKEALEVVGLADRAGSYPAQLSGGQRQRVAIGRALATQPSVLLCDEATSALDPHTSLSILRFLKKLSRERGMTMVVVTHDIKVASYLCSHCVVLEKGSVVDRIDMAKPDPQSRLGRFFFETARGWSDDTVLPEEES